MKICWDNLDRIIVSSNGSFRIGNSVYIEMGPCKKCGDLYLGQKTNKGLFCSHSCANSEENNNMYGKIHSAETRKRMSENLPDFTGSLNPNYKGDKIGLALYDTCKNRLEPYEEVRKQEGTKLLEVKCAYCGKWYIPTYIEVRNRLVAINTLNQGEQRLYCSENCKQACPTYHRREYPKGFKHTTSREVNPYLRQMVLKRDNWTCQICGKTVKEAELHVHHMDPVSQNPMFQNDVNSCITLCKHCHKMVHKQRGCRYIDLRCKKETDYTKNFKEEICLKSMNFQE